jgi:hypothetical protein
LSETAAIAVDAVCGGVVAYLRCGGLDLEGDGLRIVISDGERAFDQLGERPWGVTDSLRTTTETERNILLNPRALLGLRETDIFERWVLGAAWSVDCRLKNDRATWFRPEFQSPKLYPASNSLACSLQFYTTSAVALRVSCMDSIIKGIKAIYVATRR